MQQKTTAFGRLSSGSNIGRKKEKGSPGISEEEGMVWGLWKEIKKEAPLLKKNSMFAVGNGRRVRFWEDKWRGETPLCETFPFL